MTSHLERLARRAAVVLLTGVLATAASTVLAGPASAAVPVGWSNPDEVNITHALLVLGGIPLVLFIVIVAAVYAPSVARGERIQPGAPALENQWLGGPRKATSELAAPDTDSSQAGGSSARW